MPPLHSVDGLGIRLRATLVLTCAHAPPIVPATAQMAPPLQGSAVIRNYALQSNLDYALRRIITNHGRPSFRLVVDRQAVLTGSAPSRQRRRPQPDRLEATTAHSPRTTPALPSLHQMKKPAPSGGHLNMHFFRQRARSRQSAARLMPSTHSVFSRQVFLPVRQPSTRCRRP